MARPALRTIRLVLWGLVALALAGLAILLIRPPQQGQPAPTDYAASVGGPFTLTASDGSVVTNETLKGQPYALFFGFTRCPDVCPTTLARLAQLKQKMGGAGDRLRIVFVSVDPGHDTPADIGKYVALFNTPILGLTGTDAQIAQTAKAFHAYYAKVPSENGGDYTIDHSASVFLMDREGRLRSTLDTHEGDEAALAKLHALVE